MRGKLLIIFTCIFSISVNAQKKVIDHSVYDGWESVGERSISNNGKFVVYAINPQEGDGTLVVQSTDNSYKKIIPRGYSANFSEDNRFVIFKIRPFFKDVREARIRKKTPPEMPKDSLGILELGKDSIFKAPSVRSYKIPEDGNGVWVAFLYEKNSSPLSKPPARPDSVTQISNMMRMADSLSRIVDSIRNKANEAKTKGIASLQAPKSGSRTPNRIAERVEEGSELVLRNLHTGEEKKYPLVNDYQFSKNGKIFLLETSRKNADTLVSASIIWMDLALGKTDTVLKKFNDARSFSFDEEGTQLAFIAERDSTSKALQKFYKLYYYKVGMDSATMRVDRKTAGVEKGLSVSDSSLPRFSKDGKKLYFGLSQIRQPKDTTIPEFETARLDVWHYNDDYLQPQQLRQLRIEMGRSYQAVLVGDQQKVVQLGGPDAENVFLADEGNADYVIATSSKGNRIESQWQGYAKQTAYVISIADGTRKTIKEKHRGLFTVSPQGRYVTWYDGATKHYFAYNVKSGVTRNISKKVNTPLYDDEDDHPDEPPSFGTIGWIENDLALLVNDRYDIWQLDPDDSKAPINVTAGFGKKNRIVLKYIRFDREERFIKADAPLLLDAFNRNNKYSGFYKKTLGTNGEPNLMNMGACSYVMPIKAKQADVYLVGRMTPQESPNVYSSTDLKSFTRLSDINQQQKNYNWLTAELIKWKMFDGKESEGLVYKPENFDPKKKYPVIFYFYEQDADGLYNYRAPAPSASTINIPYFVSNGYIVMDPNIHYKDGEPGESAYNSVVSAAKHMSKFPWVDSTKMAIQGQSWGGYQVAYLVTRTKMFAAAGAGAPVANMTSAYGGIRWGTGMNRQFQYERTQTRIGATLWQRPDLYIKNSPLFKVDKISTPLMIMHNDADGAVPWYQGIELFTAMRRLNKKVWLLQYNGEDHNLVERRNRKDLSIRLGQFFDHYLKGAPAAKWISEGVPAIAKGVDYGIEVPAQEKKAF
jgi:dipeptidyl aminopeptidase/acylaminoacyl peptidase